MQKKIHKTLGLYLSMENMYIKPVFTKKVLQNNHY